MASTREEWLWGWDPTPGIVSVWAEPDGRAFVWRRHKGGGGLVLEHERFRPWMVLASLQDLKHLGSRLTEDSEGTPRSNWTFRELDGPGELRFVVHGPDLRSLSEAILQGAARRLGRGVTNVRALGPGYALTLPPEEQYLVASGRTYFREMSFDDLRRAQVDLETTGLDPAVDAIFLVAVRGPDGSTEVLEAAGPGEAEEAELLRRLVERIRELDPDVIENHNLHGFDLPFLAQRAQRLGVPLTLGRDGMGGLRERPARRGSALGAARAEDVRRTRYTVPGRELIDTMDAVLRHDFSARDLPGHGLKEVARHFGLSPQDRAYLPGSQVHAVYRTDPARVRRYAADDVHEAAGLARLLGGAAFSLAQMAPRRYERLADAGPATGVIDPLMVRAYVRAGAALPVHAGGDGTVHTGAALYLFATGVARRVVKADVASLYPSLMRQYRIGPRRDRLGVLLTLVDQLVEQRLAAKARGRAAPPGSPTRHAAEALSAAMKLVVNSAYGYLGAGSLTRFSDVHAANEVTRQGREVLALLCRQLAARGATLLEADTDGVYFSVPDTWEESREREVVAEVAALLPERVQLEFEGRYAAMLSHEAKNYALLPYAGPLILRGVAFRSSRAEPFGEKFLRQAVGCLLAGDLPGVREAYVQTVLALRRREFSAFEVSSRVRLTKSPAEYLASRGQRTEFVYEAALLSGLSSWTPGVRLRVYRATGGRPGVVPEPSADGVGSQARDYDAQHYVRLLRASFASRLERGLHAEDFAALFAAPEQPSLFGPELGSASTLLTVLPDPLQVPPDGTI